jgi:hypothetical protein
MMTADEYKALAAEFRSRALNEESPAFRAELEDLARCYESVASSIWERDAAGSIAPSF